ncbi:hypothetical protein BFR57_03490 [Idiomarina sp. MD25a]|uniref:sensor histidine kinase n=1 Tax=Idiomarina sp. MD25a TaxID=1889913 RepID=UPI0008F82E26|nr:HAMP domain-containing sensor histidine kinase [Idiomarina sp. MD25a]OIM99641.1 hypothetical protein BFR57_03490 [Idiomarina sp. MD25a]
MKANSIRAKLFISFGVLVVIISFVYMRLSYLAITTSEAVTASVLLETDPPEMITTVYSEVDLPACNSTSLLHDTKITVYECVEQTVYSYPTKDAQGVPVWKLLDATEALPFSRFNDVLNLFNTGLALVAIVLALLATWVIANRIAQPIRNLTEQVLRQRDNADASIKRLSREDEIGQLADAFYHTYSELQSALQREKDFTRDVSHELRTPITLIKNTLTLTRDDDLQPDTMKLLQQATSELQQTINVLLALARKENLNFTELVFVPLLEEAILGVHRVHADLVFDCHVDLPPQLRVYGNQHLISLLCQNLISNGFYHGDASGLKIHQSDGGAIVFENSLGESSERPYYQGLGHGQYLVKRIAKVMNWSVSIEQTSDIYRVKITPTTVLA